MSIKSLEQINQEFLDEFILPAQPEPVFEPVAMPEIPAPVFFEPPVAAEEMPAPAMRDAAAMRETAAAMRETAAAPDERDMIENIPEYLLSFLEPVDDEPESIEWVNDDEMPGPAVEEQWAGEEEWAMGEEWAGGEDEGLYEEEQLAGDDEEGLYEEEWAGDEEEEWAGDEDEEWAGDDEGLYEEEEWDEAEDEGLEAEEAGSETETEPEPESEPDAKALKKSKGRMVGDILFYTVVVLILLATLVFHNKSNESIQLFDYSAFTVLTGSMEREIPQGSLVITKKVDPNSIKAGDDITFVRSDNATVTHRVINIIENYDDTGVRGFETQGIANPDPDPDIVYAGNLVGVVKLTVPELGFALKYISENIALVFVLLGGVLVTAIAISKLSSGPKKKAPKGRKGEVGEGPDEAGAGPDEAGDGPYEDGEEAYEDGEEPYEDGEEPYEDGEEACEDGEEVYEDYIEPDEVSPEPA